MFQQLSVEEIIKKIGKTEEFRAISSDNSFEIKIESWTHYFASAIHAGHQFRADLEEICLLNEKQRWYEEDPQTDVFIQDVPMALIARDSRFEYDVNRFAPKAIYQTAWGKKVWKSPPSKEQRRVSLQKHKNIHRVKNALVRQIENEFGRCLVFDIHSFNYKRHAKDLPVFDIGSAYIDTKKHKSMIGQWLSLLSKIRLQKTKTTTGENILYNGGGSFLRSISEQFSKTLVLATEIKKIYCNEHTGEIYSQMISDLIKGITFATGKMAKHFLSDKQCFVKQNRLF